MDSAGALAGSVLNAFAINEGTVVHVLTGTGAMKFNSGTVATRRSTVAATASMGLNGLNDPHRRQSAVGSAEISFLHKANASQRHSTIGSGKINLKGQATATRRRIMESAGVLRLRGLSMSHVRAMATANGLARLKNTRAVATRRQRAMSDDTIRFLHSVNLRALAPIYGDGAIIFRQRATMVRRVGLPSIGRVKLAGYARLIARRTISTTSPISLLATIKMPHYRMTPVEEIRAMHIFEDVRGMSVLPEHSPIIVAPDNRELIVPQRGRNIGTPDTEDNA